MSRYGKGNFGSGVEINAQVVNGKCPYCTTDGVFVSIHRSIFRCITCGGDIEQKVNGKISYIPLGGDIVMKDTKDLTDG